MRYHLMMRRFGIFLAFALAFPLFGFERQPNADYHGRRERLSQKLGNGVLVFFAGTEAEGQNAVHGFRQNDGFFYLTGWREPGAAVVLAANPYREILFLPAHNVSQEKWTGPKLGADSPSAASETGFDRVDVLDHLRDELVKILPSPSATVYTDLSDNGATPSTTPIEWLRRANAFPNYAAFRDAKPLIAELRVVKDAGEIALMRKAIDASVEAHKAAMRSARPGLSENELSAIMQYEFQRRGCEEPAYSPIVGSGFNSTVLHYAQAAGTIHGGEVIVLDVGGEYSGYAADITRTLPADGHFTPRQRELYDIVLGAHDAAAAAFQSGLSTIARTTPNSLYKVAYDYLNTHGKDFHGQPLGQYFNHGLSHHLGLNVHDVGDVTKPLLPGMVFTIEPGLYIPEEKIGIRIEDDYLVGADGKLVCLSCGAPRTAADVEKAMKR